MSPPLIRIRLHTAEMSVVLPAPFGPSNPKNAPSGISRSKSSRARNPLSYLLVRPRNRRAGGFITQLKLAGPYSTCAGGERGGRPGVHRRLQPAGFRRGGRGVRSLRRVDPSGTAELRFVSRAGRGDPLLEGDRRNVRGS